MGDGLLACKLSWYVINHTTKSTQPSIPPGYLNQLLACLAGVKAGWIQVHLCRVAGNIVWAHMSHDAL